MANDPAAKPGASSNPAAKLGSNPAAKPGSNPAAKPGSGKRIARKQPSSKARSQQREADR